MKPAPLLALALLLAAPFASADWLQEGGDAAHLSYVPEEGPLRPDVALRIEAGAQQLADPPSLVVVGERAYFVQERNAIAYLDLATGEVAAFRTSAASPTSNLLLTGDIEALASDGERLFVASEGVVEALDIADGSTVWASGPPSMGGASARVCSKLALAEDLLLAACVVHTQLTGHELQVVALDAATGAQRWTWLLDRSAEIVGGEDPDVAPEARALDGGMSRVVDGLSVAGSYAYVSFHEEDALLSNFDIPSRCQPWLIALDLASLQANDLSSSWYIASATAPCDIIAPPVGTSERAWLVTSSEARAIADDEPHGFGAGVSYRLRDTVFNGNPGAGLAFDGTTVFIPFTDSLWAFPPEISMPRWRYELPPGSMWSRGPIVVMQDVVYARSNDGVLHAIDKHAGRDLWTEPLRLLAVAPAGGLIVGIADGDLIVLGDTPYSLTPRARVSADYPPVGDEVEVDLSGTPASPLGAPTQYAVDWGDGSIVMWGTEPVLRHRYAAAGDYVAYAIARNDANQTGSAAVTFFVGRDPPQNFLARQFSNENQDRTFFVGGVLITGIGALYGLFGLRRRRDLLARELAALEDAVHAARAEDGQLERALDERRYRARNLLLDHRLDEAQHAVLAARIEELSRTARLDVVEHQLDFLPHRHVRALREMLQDGRVSSLERAHYLGMLDADATLVPEYKARVRAVVDGWAAHDAGGAR